MLSLLREEPFEVLSGSVVSEDIVAVGIDCLEVFSDSPGENGYVVPPGVVAEDRLSEPYTEDVGELAVAPWYIIKQHMTVSRRRGRFTKHCLDDLMGGVSRVFPGLELDIGPPCSSASPDKQNEEHYPAGVHRSHKNMYCDPRHKGDSGYGNDREP